MVIIEQLTADIYKAIDQFERETGLLISSIRQDHEMHNGIPIVVNREIKLSSISRSIY